MIAIEFDWSPCTRDLARCTGRRQAVRTLTTSVGAAAMMALPGCAALGTATAAICGRDPERERRLDAEAAAQLLTGSAVRISTNAGDDFQAIHAQGKSPFPAIVMLHGPGRSPGDRLLQHLLITLNDIGYTVLVPQMPAQSRNCEGPETYPQTFERGFARIDTALRWLADRQQARVVLIGSWIADAYLALRPRATIEAWIVPNLTGGFSRIDNPGLRVLDLYGERASPMAVNAAGRRRAALDRFGQSQQILLNGADMEFSGRYEEITSLIDRFIMRRT